MFHLYARVHLHEVELAVLGHEELDGARVFVVDRPRRAQGRLSQPGTKFVIDIGGRRLFDELLPAPLDRTVPLAEVDDVAVPVAQDLHLDMPGLLNIPFQVQRGVVEGVLRLP